MHIEPVSEDLIGQTKMSEYFKDNFHHYEQTVLDAAVAGGIGDGGRYSPLAISMGLFGLTGMAGLGVYARSRMLNVAGNRIVSRR